MKHRTGHDNRINGVFRGLRYSSKIGNISAIISVISILVSIVSIGLAVYAAFLAYYTIQDTKGYIDLREPSKLEAEGILIKHVRNKEWKKLGLELEKIKRWPDYNDLFYYFSGIYFSNIITTERSERYLNLVSPDSYYFSKARIIIYNQLVLTDGHQEAINKTIDSLENNYVFDEFYFFIKSYDSRLTYAQLLSYYEKFARKYWLHYDFGRKQLRFYDLETNTINIDSSKFPEHTRGKVIDYKRVTDARYMPAIDFVFLQNLQYKAREECLKHDYADLITRQSLILDNFSEQKVKLILSKIRKMLGVDATNKLESYKTSSKTIEHLDCKDKFPNGILSTIPLGDLYKN